MKKQILIFTCAIALFSCGEAMTQKGKEDNSTVVQLENTDSVIVNNSQKTQQKKFFFSHKVTESISSQDERNQSNDEVEISVYIGEVKVDKFNDFGSVDYNEDKTVLYVFSEISEKTYTLEWANESQVQVKKTVFFDGEERLDWTKSYVVESNNKWKCSKCQGNCN
jgi:hypothetical protein